MGLDDEPVVKATIPECYNIQAVSTAATGMSKHKAATETVSALIQTFAFALF